MKSEIWKKVDGFPSYEISTLGNLRKTMKAPRAGAYWLVSLREDGKSRRIGIHRLMVETFIGHIGEDAVIHHKDSIPSNNDLDNLEVLSSRGMNVSQSLSGITDWSKTKLSPKDIIEIRRLCKIGNFTQIEIAAKYDVLPETVSQIYTRKTFVEIK